MVLQKTGLESFDKIFEIMDEAFPNTEMRNKEGQRKLFDKESYNVLMDETKNGFIAYWDFKDFLYLEHFAVNENLRGNGQGSQMMGLFLEKLQLPFFLEVEPPEDDMTRRRIGFYERLGFKYNDFHYIQPAMRAEESPIELKIMSYKKNIDEKIFEEYKNTIHREVYGVKN